MVEDCEILNITKGRKRTRARKSHCILSSRKSMNWHCAREQQVNVGVEEGCVNSWLSTKKKNSNYLGGKKSKEAPPIIWSPPPPFYLLLPSGY